MSLHPKANLGNAKDDREYDTRIDPGRSRSSSGKCVLCSISKSDQGCHNTPSPRFTSSLAAMVCDGHVGMHTWMHGVV